MEKKNSSLSRMKLFRLLVLVLTISNRRIHYQIIALLCVVAQGAWATDYNVGTDSELRTTIQNDGANITVTTDIDLSNSTLSIESGKTVTTAMWYRLPSIRLFR